MGVEWGAGQRTQHRPKCETCGKWKRRDHNCRPPVEGSIGRGIRRYLPDVPVASTKRLPKWRHV